MKTYTMQKNANRISPRFAHLPKPQTLALLQGLLETDGNVSRGKEITFCNTSSHLVEGVRYQCLRLGVPTAGKLPRKNEWPHRLKDRTVPRLTFTGETICYDLRIPAFQSWLKK